MPVTILSESKTAEAQEALDLLHPETGELRLEAVAMADFLAHVNFDVVFECDDAKPHVVRRKEVDEDSGVEVEVEYLPGWVAEAVDIDDLADMFEHYAASLIDAAQEEDATLAQKATAAALDALIEAPNKKGAMKRKQKGGPKKRNSVVRQMLAMIHKGVIKRTDDGYTKGKGYKKGGTPAGKMKVAKYKGQNIGKVKQAAKKAGNFAAEAIDVARFDDYPVFGLGEPYGTFAFEATLADDAKARLAELRSGDQKPKAPAAPVKTEARLTAHTGAHLAGSILESHKGAGLHGHLRD